MMRIEDLMAIMKKSRSEIENMFKENDVIELNLKEPTSGAKQYRDEGRIELLR